MVKINMNIRIMNNLIWVIISILGLMLFGWGFADQFVYYIVWIGIEWVEASSAGLMVMGFVVVFISLVGNRLTDRVLKRV